jgi:antitoxin HicB
MHAMKKNMNNSHRGDDFNSFLQEEEILVEVQAMAMKRVISLQLQKIIKEEKINKSQLAKKMQTTRASLDRILDPDNSSLTVKSIGRAAAALGRKVEINFVPA